MWVSASGVMAQMARQDVASNNLANISTTAFKPDTLPIRQRAVAREEDGLWNLDSNAMLEKLGAGVMPEATRVSLKEGPIRETGNPLDIAIRGKGFLRVESDEPAGFALSRDGRLTIGTDGTLQRAADGRHILDHNSQRITLDKNLPVTFDELGNIQQAGAPVAQLSLVNIAEPHRLEKAGNGDLVLADGMSPDQLTTANATIRQNAIEDSAVTPIGALMSVTNAARAAQGGLRMVGLMNEITGLAVSRLGRVG